MFRRLAIGALAILVLLLGASIYTARAIGPLRNVEGLLSSDVATLDDGKIEEGLASLDRAHSILTSPPAWLLRLIPIARQNVIALDEVSTSVSAVLVDTQELKGISDNTLEDGLISDGVIDTKRLERLSQSLDEQEDSLRRLHATVTRRRSGWLLPPLWNKLDSLHERTGAFLETGRKASAAARIAPAMVGTQGKRDYLVLLLNNAELRGGGGVVTAIGKIGLKDGVLKVGRFQYYADLLRQHGIEKVPAPSDLERRFGRYQSDTTLWINLTASPDIPEVAETAAQIHRANGGGRVDGVIFFDPRGLSSLVVPDQRIEVPPEIDIQGQELPEFVYSRAYEIFADDQDRRRETLLAIGPKVLRSLSQTAPNRASLTAMGRSLQGGHIRVVSFDPQEQAVLEGMDASGELTTAADDSLMVTVQNLGADKLDFWMRRSIDHRCEVVDGGARCATTVTLKNETPRGLPLYVVQDKEPYGIYKGYLEIYIPSEADVTGFSVSGQGTAAVPETEDGRTSLGTRFRTRRNTSTVATVQYELPIEKEDSYSLEITPQPLTRDASVSLSIKTPEDWTIGPRGIEERGVFEFSGELSEPLRISAQPATHPPGITGLWTSIERFWREPLF